MTNILTNSAALKSLYHLQRNEGRATEATERLASGKRLNKAGDDAAGAAIVNRMSSQINGMEVAIRNAGDAISMAQTAEGALNEVSEILQRMRELGVQAANGTYSGADRVALNEEIGALKKELIRISEATQFNTSKLLNGTFQDTEFEIGYDESPQHTHTLSIENIKPTALGIWSSSTQLEKTATAASATTGGVITTTASHGFEFGDVVTFEQPAGSTALSGFVSGRQYTVTKPVTANTFTLTEIGTTPAGDATETHRVQPKEVTVATGAGVKFHLANIAGSPTTTVSGSTTALNSLTNKDESLRVYGYVGDTTISYATGATSKDISEAITAQSGITGVTAYAETNVRLTVTPDSNTSSSTIISFKLSGMNSSAKVISSTVNFGTIDGKNMADLSDLRDKINGFTGDTGIQAKLSADKQTLDLRSPDGYDILIDDYDMPMETAANIPPGVTGNVKAAAEADDEKLTFASAHGLVDGDAVRVIQSSAPDISGTAAGTATKLLTGQVYFFKDVSPISTTVGQLMDADGNVLAFDADGVDLEFEKITKSLNVQTLDRDLVAKGAPVHLHDDTLAGGESPGTRSSMRVSGQIIYQSPNVFTVTTPSTLSTSSKALHRDAAPAASLTRISDVNVKTVMGAQRLLSAVDGALRRVDAERGDLGATMNRMEHTIDNLSNIVMNTKISRSRMQDADMAAESIELTKGRILQQAATSMLSQANQSMQSVLELLQ
tara:strand:- start:133 stop:2307 length:2175 start_codon:yes stop_codon:yes gene_type:complete